MNTNVSKTNIRIRLAASRSLLVLSGIILAAMPGVAQAHENVGGDELAAANWMLIGAFVVFVMGALAGVWAWKAGQFTNIEESKYNMLDTAEDYDAIMAEADARESALASTGRNSGAGEALNPKKRAADHAAGI